MRVGEDGKAWIGTLSGAASFDGRRWREYTTSTGLAHNSVFDIDFDSDGDKWFATFGGGVSELRGDIFFQRLPLILKQ